MSYSRRYKGRNGKENIQLCYDIKHNQIINYIFSIYLSLSVITMLYLFFSFVSSLYISICFLFGDFILIFKFNYVSLNITLLMICM